MQKTEQKAKSIVWNIALPFALSVGHSALKNELIKSVRMHCKKQQAAFLLITFILASFVSKAQSSQYTDNPYTQDYSIKFLNTDNDARLLKVVSDRNGYIQVLSSKGLLRTRAGQLLFPGTLVTDEQDKQISDKKIAGIGTYQEQLVYIDKQAVLSNAWAGKLFSKHSMPEATIFAGGKDFAFLVSDGKNVKLLKDSKDLWESNLSGEVVKDIKFDITNNVFWILGTASIHVFSPISKELTKVFTGNNLT
jgi:hypothetical protein